MFIEQAYRVQHEFWRYLVGLVLIITASVIGQLPLTVAVLFSGDAAFTEKAAASQAALFEGMDKNLLVFLMLLSFAVGFVGFILAIRLLHQQKLKSVTTSRKKVDWKRILFGFSLIAVFTIVVTFIDFQANPKDYVVNFELFPFLILLGIAVVMIPIQTSFEEYVFRGYLMQGFGMLSKNRWFPLLMTSVIFGGLHIFNPEVGKLGYLIMVHYIGTGLLLGIMTLMDEGMELALGFHAGNNLIGILLVTADWTAFQSESILKDISDPAIGFDVLLPVLVIYPLFLLLMAKVYGWKNWKEKLFGKLSLPGSDEKLQQN